MKTYYSLVIGISIILYSCASQNEDTKAYAPSAKYEESVAMEEVEKLENIEEEINGNSNSFSRNKWRKKAQQQLETLEDLLKILQDSSLDKEFKATIEEEVLNIYPTLDSNDYLKTATQLKFKHFRVSEKSNNDTIKINFKNKKDQLEALFVIDKLEKTFGNSVELTEELKLVSIEVSP